MNRILFVDDEPRVLSGLRRMLRSRMGEWDMCFVESGPAALEVMEANPVDVVVSDFRMPGMSGGQLLAEVRRRHPDTARLILSGHTEEKDLTTVVSLAHQFLTKPCQPDELVLVVERALRLRRDLDGEHVRARISEVGMLPSPPSTLHDLLAILESPTCDAKALAGVLERDMALSAKVLQLVNSSFFAPRARVTSLEDAVVRLGIGTIRSLVLMGEMARASQIPDPAVRRRLELLNRHALETARLAGRLAVGRVRDDAFCAGLLHESGQLVLAACRPEAFAAHVCSHELGGLPMVDAELETFGVTHAQAGAYLLSLWGFPLEVVETVARHAEPMEPLPPERSNLLAMVQLAHLLVESERICVCGRPERPGPDDALLEAAGVLDEVRSWRAEHDEKTL